MAKVLFDLVVETSITTGAGALALAGALNALYQSASTAGVVNGDTFDYVATDAVNSLWESGLGTWGTGGILTRTTVTKGSNGTSPVVWPTGTRTITMCLTAAQVNSLLSKAGGTLTGALNYAATATIASAATTDIGASTSNSIIVTGTTTITGLGTIAAGAERAVTFSGVLVLTYNAATLILPGAANITTAPGDVAYFISLGAGNWRCSGYQTASGLPVVNAGASPALNLFTAQTFGAL